MGGLVVLQAANNTRPHSVILIEASPPGEVQGFNPEAKITGGTAPRRVVAFAYSLSRWRGPWAWRRRHDLCPAETAVVGDGISDIEQGSEAPPGPLASVEDADLVGVWIDADVRAVHLADHQHPHRPVTVVAVSVRTALAAREGDDLSFWKLFPASGAAKAEPPLEDDQQLLALNVVVENHLLARLEFVQARAEVLGAGRFGEPNGVDAVGRHFEGIVQVAHARSVRCASR